VKTTAPKELSTKQKFKNAKIALTTAQFAITKLLAKFVKQVYSYSQTKIPVNLIALSNSAKTKKVNAKHVLIPNATNAILIQTFAKLANIICSYRMVNA